MQRRKDVGFSGEDDDVFESIVRFICNRMCCMRVLNLAYLQNSKLDPHLDHDRLFPLCHNIILAMAKEAAAATAALTLIRSPNIQVTMLAGRN